MSIVCSILLFLIVILLLFLLMPVYIEGAGLLNSASKAFAGQLKLFGSLICFHFNYAGGQSSISLTVVNTVIFSKNIKASERAKSDDPEISSKKDFPLRKLINVVTDEDLRSSVIGFLRKLVKSLNLKLKLEGVFGTDEPALTGMLFGFIFMLRTDNIVLNLQPDFTDLMIDINGSISSRFIPAHLLGQSLAFLFSKPVRRLWLPKFINKFKLKEVIPHV